VVLYKDYSNYAPRVKSGPTRRSSILHWVMSIGKTWKFFLLKITRLELILFIPVSTGPLWRLFNYAPGSKLALPQGAVVYIETTSFPKLSDLGLWYLVCIVEYWPASKIVQMSLGWNWPWHRCQLFSLNVYTCSTFSQNVFGDSVQKLLRLSCPLFLNCASVMERSSTVTFWPFSQVSDPGPSGASCLFFMLVCFI